MKSWYFLQAIAVLAVLGTPLRGTAEPAVELLPAPRSVIIEVEPPTVVYLPATRVSHYAVWQHYGVDRYGRFRPRVVYAPYGAYYSHDGTPYPWAQSRPLQFMPYVSDGASGSR